MAPGTATTSGVCALPEVREALARGDWTVVLQAFRRDGLSQATISDRTGLSQSQISRLASGRSKTPGITTVKALCDGLGVPRTLAGLLADGEEDDTDRRQFLGGTLGVLAAAAIPMPAMPDEQLLMATTLSYRQLEQRTPARSLTQPVTAHLQLAWEMARRPDGPQRARLSAAVAEAAGLAAWLHADLAEPGQARRFYKMAVTASQQAHNPLLAVYMQGSLGQYATLAGDPAQGLRLLRDAAARLPRSAPPTARAGRACLEAVALGDLGDRAALTARDQAQRHAEAGFTARPVWPWLFPLDPPKIASYRATATSRLGMATAAMSAFAQAEVARSPKQAALVTVEHARVLAIGGHLDQACALAVAAYDTGRAYESERVQQAVRQFRVALPAQAPRRVTAELDDRLRSAYSAAT